MLRDRWTLLALAATAVILVLCLAPKRWVPPGEQITPAVAHQDKVVHFVMFAAFGFLWAKSGPPGRLRAGKAAVVLVGAVVLAVGTELAQGLEVINRDGDPMDALADVGGAVAAVGWIATRGRN